MVINNTNRAKQFLPFDALTGLKEAMEEKEIEYEEKKDLTEESLVELENIFNQIEINDKVKIRYYKNKKYVTIIGKVTFVDYIKKKIQIDKKQNINISDIIDIAI